MYKCFNEESCIRTRNNTRVECNTGKGYDGPLCGACDRSVDAIRSGKSCIFCWEPWLNYLASSGIATGWIGLIGYYNLVAMTLKAFDVQRPVGSELLLPVSEN